MEQNKILLITINLLGSLLVMMPFSGCKPLTSSSSLTQSEAIGSEAELTRSFEVAAATRSYLPYDYKKTGCNERSLYVSMELAAQGLVSSSAWIFGSLQYGPQQDDSWGNHTAPIVSGSTRPTIDNSFVLDYALTETPPTVRDWVDRSQKYRQQFSRDNALQLLVTEPANGIPDGLNWLNLFPSLLYVDSPEGLNQVLQTYRLTRSMNDITPFLQRKVERACHTLYGHLGEKGMKDSAKRRQLLVEKTRQLINQLELRGLYLSEGRELQCPNKKYDVWFPPESSPDTAQSHPVLQAVSACKIPAWRAVTMVKPATAPGENQCEVLKDLVQALNMHGAGLSDPENQGFARCLQQKISCADRTEIDQYVKSIVEQSSSKPSACKPIGGSITPRSCEDIKFLTRYERGPRIELACWQQDYRCTDRLRTLLPNLL